MLASLRRACRAERGNRPHTHMDSALHDNIKSKGTNSYYYAHATTAPPESRYVSGDGPPQLVSTGPLASGGSAGGAAAAAPTPAAPLKLPVTSYSWLDDDADICLYIPLETLEGLTKEAVTTAIGPAGTTLTVTFPALGKGVPEGRVRCLLLDGLAHPIANARVLIGAKNSRLVVRLGKKDAAPWHKLLASERPFSGDD